MHYCVNNMLYHVPDAIIGVTYFSAIDPADFGRFDAAFVSLFKVTRVYIYNIIRVIICIDPADINRLDAAFISLFKVPPLYILLLLLLLLLLSL